MTISPRLLALFLLLVVASRSDAQWLARSTFPTPQVNAITFITPERGIAAGVDYFSVTTNGGIDWTPSALPLRGVIDAITFPTAQVGYMSGYAYVDFTNTAALYRTDDAGATWRRVLNGGPEWQHPRFRSVVFFGPDTGFVSGNGLKRTTDGGATWTDIAMSSATVDPPDRDLQFPTRSVGFAITSQRKYPTRSTDGGLTWTRLTSPREFVALEMASPTVGYAIANTQEVYRTTDGGASWTLLETTWIAAIGAQSSASTPRILHFTSDDAGTMIGTHGNFGAGTAAGTTFIVHTTDGGKTWTPDSSFGRPNIAMPAPNGYAVDAEGNAYLVGGAEIWKRHCITPSPIVADGPTTMLEGSTVELSLPEAMRYAWSTGDTTRSIDVSLRGTYHGSVLYADGCAGFDTVVVETEPLAPLVGSSEVPCDGGCSLMRTREEIGRIVVAGLCGNGVRITAHDMTPAEVWSEEFNGGDNPTVTDMTIAPNGDVYVALASNPYTQSIAKIARDGSYEWIRSFTNGPPNGRCYVTVDSAGRAIFARSTWIQSIQRSPIIVTCFAPDGAVAWEAIHRDGGTIEEPIGVGVDAAGNVYVAGRAYRQTTDIVVARYSRDGVPAWTKHYDRGAGYAEQPVAFTIAPDGTTVVAAESINEAMPEKLLVVVARDSAGVEKWAHTEPGPAGLGWVMLVRGEEGSHLLHTTWQEEVVRLGADGAVAWRLASSPDTSDRSAIVQIGVAALGLDRLSNAYIAGDGQRYHRLFSYTPDAVRRWRTYFDEGDEYFLRNGTPIGIHVARDGDVYVAVSETHIDSLDEEIRLCSVHRYRQRLGIASIGSEREETARPGVSARIDRAGEVTVTLERPLATDGSITLHDVTGRLVATLHDGALAAGTHRFAVGLAPGAYVVGVATAGGVHGIVVVAR